MIRSRTAAILIAGALLWAGTAHAQDYRLQRGDLLELVVIAPQDLREQMRVDVDGNISVPILGIVPAEGRSLAEVAAEVRNKLASASLPPMFPGDTLPGQIWPSAVSLSLKEYRPVYVGGDVRSEGAFPFSPGLTARRAIVLAGGYGLTGAAGGNPLIQRLDLQAALGGFRTKRAGALARLERLRLELDADMPAAPVGGHPSPIVAAERDILTLRREQDATAASHFEMAIGDTRQQIDGLREQLANETEGMEADRQDYDRLKDMRAAGTVTALRLTDSRRALLFATTRQLETASELARTKRELGTFEYDRLRQRLDVRLDAVRQISSETQMVAELDEQIASTERRLALLERLDAEAAEVTISITGSDGIRSELTAGQDRPLRPGDLVIVSLGIGRPATD